MIEKRKIAYDLGLNQSMYCVPEGVIRKLEDKYPVEFKLINVPGSEKIDQDAEIYWGNRISHEMLEKMPNLKWVHFGSVGINRLKNLGKSDILITSSKGLVTSAMTTNIISLIGIFARKLDIFFQNEATRPKSRDDFEKYFNSKSKLTA